MNNDKKIFSYYFSTFFTEFIVLAAGILVYKAASLLFDEKGFAEYALCRRTLSFVLPMVVMGMGVAIPRYVAFSAVSAELKNKGSYFSGGVILAVAVTVPVVLSINVFRETFSYLLFGDMRFAYLLPYLSVMIVGAVFHALVYGYYRGLLNVRVSNGLQLVNMGGITLLAFAFARSLPDVILYTGTGWLLVSLFPLFHILKKNTWNLREIRHCTRELFVYGVQRFPGDVLLAGYFALPAYFTAHLVADELRTAGFIAFGMSLLNMAGAAFGPVCLLLLPQASQAIAKKDFNLLKKYSNIILRWTLGLTCLGLVLVQFFTDDFLSLFSQESAESLSAPVRVILYASPGYTVYIALRSILDAYYVTAMNTKNIIISFLLFFSTSLLSIWFHPDYLYILYSFVVSILVLGILTIWETKKIHS